MDTHPLVIGLTGGIGSGKSTIAYLFAKHHVPIIDADIIAHTLTQPEQQAYHSIIQHFGQDMLLANRTLNRKKLRQLIFQNTTERQWLENMLHPIIRIEIEKQLQTISFPYCIVVIPLLFETMQGHAVSYHFLDRILVIDTPTSLQIERASIRDKVTTQAIETILATQVTREYRLTQAHDIIINDGQLDEVIPQVDKLHRLYLKLASNPN